MSVVKSKRSQSKIEFENLYFKLADNVDNLVEHKFYAKEDILERNRVFLDIRCRSLNDISSSIVIFVVNNNKHKNKLK